MTESESPIENAQAPGYLKEKAKREQRREKLIEHYQDFIPQLEGGLLEIGCGHGHWLADYANQHPDQTCIGVDLLGKRITKASSKVGKRQLENLRFAKAEAIEFIELLPNTVGLKDVMILFPDPWPKKRHHRRRIIQPSFLELMASKMQAGGKLYFRTDHDPYFDWATEVISNDPHWELDKELHWPMELPTYFQELMDSYQSLSATVKKG